MIFFTEIACWFSVHSQSLGAGMMPITFYHLSKVNIDSPSQLKCWPVPVPATSVHSFASFLCLVWLWTVRIDSHPLDQRDKWTMMTMADLCLCSLFRKWLDSCGIRAASGHFFVKNPFCSTSDLFCRLRWGALRGGSNECNTSLRCLDLLACAF